LTTYALFGGRVYQDSRHSYGYRLCSSSLRLIPLLVQGILHNGYSQETPKEASPILWFHFPLYRWHP